QIPNLLNSQFSGCIYPVFYFRKIIAIRHFFYVAPANTFPYRTYVDINKQPVVFSYPLIMCGFCQQIDPIPRTVDMISTFKSSPVKTIELTHEPQKKYAKNHLPF